MRRISAVCVAAIALFVVVDGATVFSGKDAGDVPTIREELFRNREEMSANREVPSVLDNFYEERAAVLAAEASEYLGADEVLNDDEKRARDR